MRNKTFDVQEDWIKWNPFNMPEGSYIVTSFSQDENGVKITLDDENNVVELFFDGVPSIIRISVEGIRMRTWGEVQQKYCNKGFFRNWFLFKVENSKLSKWAVEESCGFYEIKQLTHYCIVTSEELIDILATFEPNLRTWTYHVEKR
ncbi:MAG: hypothetical protein FWC60_05990 [Firmicutes bacterium]|nr:hypothetical protein [Bacillota bacterium]